MNIDAFKAMDDDQFDQCVSQAVKKRDHEWKWWKALLHPDLIDDTEASIQSAIEHAEEQALNPERYPAAGGFARKMRGVLAEITLEKLTRDD